MEERLFYYLPLYYYAENQVGMKLKYLSSHDLRAPFEDMERAVELSSRLLDIELSDQQRQAVEAAATSGVVVITGGPGTGKTTVIRCILEVLEQAGNKVELAAPTGRAAKRMSQASEHEARTLHRLLEYSFDGQAGGFSRDEDNPLECDAVIVDEVSMMDIFLMQALMRAMMPGMRLILVGDSDQLPSVGPGMVLRDVMESGIAKVCRLTEIFRQARESMIVVNAHRVNEGMMPDLRSGKDFFFESRVSAEAVYESVKNMISTRIPGFLHCDGMNDIQVLVPIQTTPAYTIDKAEKIEIMNTPIDITEPKFT
jgi:exodeoxyribonuclease V alpha subunit